MNRNRSIQLTNIQDDGCTSNIFTKNAPAFETADTSLGSDIQDIPGNIIGYLHENSDVIRVRIGAAAAHINSVNFQVLLGSGL